jgi:stage II sporulation protein M
MNVMSFRFWLAVAIALFAFGIAWGGSSGPGATGGLPREAAALGDLAGFVTGLPAWLMFFFILFKNVSAVLFGFVFSPLLLIVPLVSLVANGWLIGYVARSIVSEQSLTYLLKGILPHGIFELPALFVGEAAALTFGVAAIQALFFKDQREQFTSRLRTCARYLTISAVLFVPAALIEAFVTPRLLAL